MGLVCIHSGQGNILPHIRLAITLSTPEVCWIGIQLQVVSVISNFGHARGCNIWRTYGILKERLKVFIIDKLLHMQSPVQFLVSVPSPMQGVLGVSHILLLPMVPHPHEAEQSVQSVQAPQVPAVVTASLTMDSHIQMKSASSPSQVLAMIFFLSICDNHNNKL